jgi:LuxR family transcriptional regulator, glucitol operon activator
VAVGKDINQIVDSLKSSSSDIARFCFEQIYDTLLSPDARMVMCCLAASDRPLTRGVLTHVSSMQSEQLDKALRDLTLASLVIQEQEESKDHTITTKYSLLPLTLGYLGAKLRDQQELWRTIQGRMELASGRIEEARQVGHHYRYALQDLGATTDEERIAASWALTAYQRSQNGDYVGAVEAFKRAVEIAPKFARLYRNWATIEAGEGYFERANELMEKAIKLSPKDPTLWFVWGNIEKRRNRLDKARKHFQTAYDLSPNDGAVLGGLGEVEKRSGNYELADKYFKQALNVPRELHGFKHEMITYTAIANNLTRWAKTLWNDRQSDAALEKAKSAYEYASRAVKMSRNDTQAEDTLRDAAFELAMQLSAREGIDTALPLFQEAIIKNPKRWKERSITSDACYYLAKKLLEAGRIDESKYYFHIGRKNIATRGDEDRVRYEKLEADLLENRFRGKISYTPEGKSYGFIEREDVPGQSLFVHRSAFIPPISGEELRRLLGARVSFAVEKTTEGLQAKNVRIMEN